MNPFLPQFAQNSGSPSSRDDSTFAISPTFFVPNANFYLLIFGFRFSISRIPNISKHRRGSLLYWGSPRILRRKLDGLAIMSSTAYSGMKVGFRDASRG